MGWSDLFDAKMSTNSILRLGSIKSVRQFKEHLGALQLSIPCDLELASAAESPLRQPLVKSRITIGNRIAVQPMEGWDGTADGNPSEMTLRRWRRFGSSGAKLIWGGEAVAVSHEGRANPNQLVAAAHTYDNLARLREALAEEHRLVTGSDAGLLLGLQLTHSGRFSRPNAHDRGEPRILYRHPLLDRRLRLPHDYPVLTDGEIRAIVEDFHRAAAMAYKLGFHFVDIKHCHGYLGHEFLSAHTREGAFGGNFENRTRFLREIVKAVRAAAPNLLIGVRLSAFDTIPFRKITAPSPKHQLGTGVPESLNSQLPYRWGFGVNPDDPSQLDLAEPVRLLSLISDLKVNLVNIFAGSPYYNPHVQRPAFFPPSDGYLPPEDPLKGVARQMQVTHKLKQQFPNLVIVGSAYSYLQEFLPNVAQAAVREAWTDCVGLGRMILTYPSLPLDVIQGRPLQRKIICRTFSDCTSAPRSGLPSGCYPLDPYYKNSAAAVHLKNSKARRRIDAD